MNKTPFKDKKRVSIFLPEEKEKEFKMKAVEAGVSLSQFLETAGTVTSVNQVNKVIDTSGAAPISNK